MKKLAYFSLLLTLLLSLTIGPGLAAAQGPLDAQFTSEEQGFSISHPADWQVVEIEPGFFGIGADPMAAMSAPIPEEPVMFFFALDAEIVNTLSSMDGLTQSFLAEFGDGTEMVSTMDDLAASLGAEVMRTRANSDAEGFSIEMILIGAPERAYMIWLAGPSESYDATVPTFDAMLNTITLSTPTGSPTNFMPPGVTVPSQPLTPELPPVNGVRITLDQEITGGWNEIDAVELVGIDDKDNELAQWASSAEATSQYGEDSWSAQQATGAPDTPECGDYTTAWASAESTGQDTLTVYFDTPVIPSAVNIHQSYNPGAIVMVEALPADGSEPIVVFEGMDTTFDCPGVLSLSFGGGGEIMYGETMTGEITESSFAQEWTFEGMAEDVVTITMVDVSASNTLDPYLLLRGPDGATLIENDDDMSGDLAVFDSRITAFTLPADGTYTIVATRYGQDFGSAVGPYELTLTQGEPEAAAPSMPGAGGGMIGFGETLAGEITMDVFAQEWTFDAVAGDIVTITMIDTSAEASLDTYLQLLSPDGTVVTENDDADSPTAAMSFLDSQIANYPLPVDGTYTIVATRFGQDFGTSVGTYSLSLEYGSAPGLTSEPVGSLTYGETVTGEISETASFQDWTFDALAGDVVTITMVDTSSTDTLDPYLSLLNPDGLEVAYNDDSVDPNMAIFDSQIDSYTIPADGTYTIRATRYGQELGDTYGPYELTITASK